MVTYANKLCLAPMVRSGELPMRLMALKYGADLVWSPEIIDKKIMSCIRVENKDLGAIDFFELGKDNLRNSLVFRTKRSLEKGKLIFQLGSADPQLAVAGAEKVIKDVDGIDLNCGCPKPFSTHSGMGAALLSTPDLLVLILLNLVKEIGHPNGKPISAKIRLLNSSDAQPTLDLVERICKTGISNLTVHCRTREMRNRDAPIRNFVNEIHEVTKKHNVSLIINGAFRCKLEFKQFQKFMGNYEIGGMMAEAAESNPTVFCDRPLPWRDVIPEFIQFCISCDNHPSNTKYILLNQLPGKSRLYQAFCKIKKNDEFLKLANTIGEEGDKVFIRIRQKDKQYTAEELVFGQEETNPLKRAAENGATEALEKKQRTVCA
ncbi:FMN-linked oxidoreductase [Metschnikowia bicuspidata var. bicuspidata NRRL YB-4993]|uniref:FMN-linked oxidoreductase n=1 Tax=Metschnikowia bicuspidata var. bicuspidata NRRL YB-4993 TaxID=869754 RepID=A0A1A0HCK0_9ASCO|nr:FMN-linked oxidoreductase [Metschnikowia bicuspidata var. bicuspidata NRRL YB-4993]OBA21720.1 FMN-linked oxidoreductase [Metschnikowia bicuspidata var. bicuspidata NRRL YB-4993]